jgi:uncharacterized protein YkwD
MFGSNGSNPTSRIQNYGNIQGNIGQSTNYGSDSALETVIRLYINDGDRSRQDRQKLISRSFRESGVASCKHKSSDQMSTIVYGV